MSESSARAWTNTLPFWRPASAKASRVHLLAGVGHVQASKGWRAMHQSLAPASHGNTPVVLGQMIW